MPRPVAVVGTMTIPDFIETNMEDFADWMQAATVNQGPAWITPCNYLPNLQAVAAAIGVDPSTITIFNLSADYGSRVTEPTP